MILTYVNNIKANLNQILKQCEYHIKSNNKKTFLTITTTCTQINMLIFYKHLFCLK